MKSFITIIAAALLMSISVSAQDSYYYYDGGKMMLTQHPARFVSISPKSDNTPVAYSDDYIVVDTISDSKNAITVYELNRAASIQKAIARLQLPQKSLVPCYQTDNISELIPNGYINVKLKEASDYTKLQRVANEMGCEIVSQNQFMPLWYNLCIIPESCRNPVDIANAIFETGEFAYSSPSFSMDGLEISYDPDVHKQWGLYNSTNEEFDISVSRAWNYATGRGVVVAVIDNGIDLEHKDLRQNIYSLSYDAQTNSSPSKLYGIHGTHVAGIIAAVRNNGIQVSGVAPDAKLMSISTFPRHATNPEMKLAMSINWAWKNGADIISCSWHCKSDPMIEEAIDSAVIRGRNGKGCIFVKSAGNVDDSKSDTNITFPGNYSSDVLAVSNMEEDGNISKGSCYGSNLFVTAPGTNIYSTIPKDRIEKKSGTSMACPHVSGVAALILEINPNLTALEVREIMAKNTNKIGNIPYNIQNEYGAWNEKYGYGLIDAYKSVINTPRIYKSQKID